MVERLQDLGSRWGSNGGGLCPFPVRKARELGPLTAYRNRITGNLKAYSVLRTMYRSMLQFTKIDYCIQETERVSINAFHLTLPARVLGYY